MPTYQSRPHICRFAGVNQRQKRAEPTEAATQQRTRNKASKAGYTECPSRVLISNAKHRKDSPDSKKYMSDNTNAGKKTIETILEANPFYLKVTVDSIHNHWYVQHNCLKKNCPSGQLLMYVFPLFLTTPPLQFQY